MNLWENDLPISSIEGLDITIPHWIEQDITPADVAAIVQGGCASGAYMPAVTYRDALDTMHEHGDDVLEYVEQNMGELPAPKNGESWAGMAVFYLSCAVELWASSVSDELEAFEPEEVEVE